MRGGKQWITNGGMSDVLTTLSKDGGMSEGKVENISILVTNDLSFGVTDKC